MKVGERNPCAQFDDDMAEPMFHVRDHLDNKSRRFVTTCVQFTLPFCKRRAFCWANHFVRTKFGPHSLLTDVGASHFTTHLFFFNWKQYEAGAHICLRD